MRTIRRLGVGSLLALSACYLVQVNDSVPPALAQAQARPPVPVAQVLVAGSLSADHDYFVSRRNVVPVGLQTISLPILMYHYIRTPPSMRSDYLGYKLSVAPTVFEAQMDWLSIHGYNAVDFNDVRAYFAGALALPAQPVVITFDDGYADLFTAAYPILMAHRFKAVAYIVSGFVGRSGYVTADQLLQMDHDGIQIASHTIDHPNLARSSASNVEFQLSGSKGWLERVLGHPVLDFAYPSGQFNTPVVNAVERAGYNTAVTTLTSTNHSLGDRYHWSRVRVGGGESLQDFAANLGPMMPSTTIRVLDVEEPTHPPKPPRLRHVAREFR